MFGHCEEFLRWQEEALCWLQKSFFEQSFWVPHAKFENIRTMHMIIIIIRIIIKIESCLLKQFPPQIASMADVRSDEEEASAFTGRSDISLS